MKRNIPNPILLSSAAILLVGCVEDEQGVSPFSLTASATPSTCKDALYEVVQAERAYDLGMAGSEQVRQAVLAANRLCGQ